MTPQIVTLNTPGGGGRRPGRPVRPRLDWTGHTYKHETELRVNYGHVGRDRNTDARSKLLSARTIPHMPGVANLRSYP